MLVSRALSAGQGQGLGPALGHPVGDAQEARLVIEVAPSRLIDSL